MEISSLDSFIYTESLLLMITALPITRPPPSETISLFLPVDHGSLRHKDRRRSTMVILPLVTFVLSH